MNLSQIEYFLAVSEKLNFTAAAQMLFISQPALSKQIRMMEEELGIRLFTRSKRNVALTEAGLAFKQDLGAVLDDLNRAIEHVKSIGSRQSGKIRFACFPGPAADDLIYSISEKLKQALPGVGAGYTGTLIGAYDGLIIEP